MPNELANGICIYIPLGHSLANACMPHDIQPSKRTVAAMTHELTHLKIVKMQLILVPVDYCLDIFKPSKRSYCIFSQKKATEISKRNPWKLIAIERTWTSMVVHPVRQRFALFRIHIPLVCPFGDIRSNELKWTDVHFSIILENLIPALVDHVLLTFPVHLTFRFVLMPVLLLLIYNSCEATAAIVVFREIAFFFASLPLCSFDWRFISINLKLTKGQTKNSVFKPSL